MAITTDCKITAVAAAAAAARKVAIHQGSNIKRILCQSSLFS
jgi:hypothetical protein